MTTRMDPPKTLADVLTIAGAANLPGGRHRDLVSAIKRLCEMAGTLPAWVPTEAPVLRGHLNRIRPAAAGVSAKTFADLRSLLRASLELAGVIDPLGRGQAHRHAVWGPLLGEIASDKRMSNGLAAFVNWCAVHDVAPLKVTDETVQRFLVWLETRTLYPKPRDLVCRLPRLWNEASRRIPAWPRMTLTRPCLRTPRRRPSWDDLRASLRHDAERYLARRAEPDVFDDAPDGPRRPLAPATLRQQREHLRLAASVLVESGIDVAEVASLADLVEPERFKRVLRHYHNQANGKPNAFAIGLAKTLIQVARHHVGASVDEVTELKRVAGKLPSVPFDLTDKNKALLRQLESEQLRARLHFLPEEVLAKIATALDACPLRFVEAQVAIGIDILLAAPLRPQNLSDLSWRDHVLEPDGPKGRLLLHIPAAQTKSRRQDLTVEIPHDVAMRLRWYRRHILPRLDADPSGFLFVTAKGAHKSQETLSQQITEALAEHVGIHMTPHQFRHFGAASYLEANPEDFETVRAMLGHSSSKTTLIYAGSSSQRASRAFGQFLFAQRDKLKLSRTKKPKRRN